MQPADRRDRRFHRFVVMAWMLVWVVCAAAVTVDSAAAQGQPAAAQATAEDNNPRANFWRAIRRGVEGYSAVQGQETNVLIQGSGENWRMARERLLVPIVSGLLGAVLVIILLYHILHGRIPLEGGRSGRRVRRFSLNQQLVHWFAAILFVLLGLTGIVLLLGRSVLIPLMGKDAFAVSASLSKEVHNLFGPIFILAVLLMLFSYIRGNGFSRIDWLWLKRAGGLFGKGHVAAGKYNMGQKLWFWSVVLIGTVLCGSGLVLDFAVVGQERWIMQLAQISHVVGAVVLMVAGIGHAYIGSVGMEGALEAMTQGEVDANWAKEHHSLWYEQIEAGEGNPAEGTKAPQAGSAPAAGAATSGR